MKKARLLQRRRGQIKGRIGPARHPLHFLSPGKAEDLPEDLSLNYPVAPFVRESPCCVASSVTCLDKLPPRALPDLPRPSRELGLNYQISTKMILTFLPNPRLTFDKIQIEGCTFLS